MELPDKKTPIWRYTPRLRLAVFQPRKVGRGWTSRRHRHPFFELGLVLQGRCRWMLGSRGRHVDVEAGQAILLSPQQDHAEQAGSDCATQLAWVGFDFPEASPPVRPWWHRSLPLGEERPAVEETLRTLLAEHSRNTEDGDMRVRLLLHDLLVLLERCGAAAPSSRITRAKVLRLGPRQSACVAAAGRYLVDNLSRPTRIREVARMHSLCPAHFSTLFRRHFGVSPVRYLLEARLAEARRMLSEGTETIKEIAHRCGFPDASRLAKVFRRASGQTASHYRLRCRGKASITPAPAGPCPRRPRPRHSPAAERR